MSLKKNLVKYLIAGIVLVAVIAGMALLYQKFRPQGVIGSKEITIEVVIPKEKTKSFTINTDAKYLRQALEEKKLVKGTESKYGLFITTVNGHKANNAKQEWWCVTKGGQQVNTGVDKTPIKNGDQFEITLITGY